MTEFSNLAKVVIQRTYARKKKNGKLETWPDIVERAIRGNTRGFSVSQEEIDRLWYLLINRKAGPAGRGWWYSGTEAHEKLGGVALSNCWYLNADSWENYIQAQDLLMLGGGVGMSVEHRFVSKLPKVKKNVMVTHKPTKDADFIIPDSREGWCELTRKVLEAFFVTGKGFSFSTVCIRGAGEVIRGFGGYASGPLPLVTFADKISALLSSREGKNLRPIDAADLLCSVGELVVSGNVRRSALIILGDPWDKDYLKAKRWDLGPIPTQRAMANFSVVMDDIEDAHPLFWKTYENGEPFGILNRKNMQKYARMGDVKKDTAVGTNPCVPAGTKILTDLGYRAIDSLVGQTVNVWNGNEFSPVQPQVTGTNQKLVKVTFSSGQSLVCTKDHTFPIKNNLYKDNSFELVKAKDLVIYSNLAKFVFPVIDFGEEVSKKRAYSQGFYSGDGNASTTESVRRDICLYGEKTMCAERMSGHLGKFQKSQDRAIFHLDFVPEDKGFIPFGWSVGSRLEWLGGLLDSDGIELKEGGVQVASVDESFLLQTQKLLTTLGVVAKVSKGREAQVKMMPDGKGGKKEYHCLALYRMCIGATQIQALKTLGLKCERLTFDKTPQRDAYRFATVSGVEDAGTADVVYCFKEGKLGLGCFEGIVTGQCGEASLESGEACNLQDIALSNISDEKEFEEAARLMHRWGKRVAMEKYHWENSQEIISRNHRIGTGITGCLRSPLFTPAVLDRVYAAIQDENVSYSKELGIPESIRTTVVKPSGTVSKCYDMAGYEGIHAAYSRYYIQRVRFSANDPLVAKLREAGHKIEPVIRFDGTLDHTTVVCDFYEKAPEGFPVADEDWSTEKQLEVLKMAQRHWADQAVSVTVYYKRDDLPWLKTWLQNNLGELKSISFLCHSEHGFLQAPKEKITKEQFEELSEKISPVQLDDLTDGGDLVDLECAGGSCPIR